MRSESASYNLIGVARKSQETPQLRAAIQSGVLGVSKARKMISVMTSQNQIEWIEKAKTLSTRQLEKEVARVNPKEATPERAKYVSGKRLQLSLGVSEKLMLELRRVQTLVSQSNAKHADLELTIETAVAFYIQHKDPVEKAKRVIAKKGVKSVSVSSDTRQKPAAVQHEVRIRDTGRCQFPNCKETRWTDLHHIVPVSQGGPHSAANLITLCRAHHQFTHAVHASVHVNSSPILKRPS